MTTSPSDARSSSTALHGLLVETCRRAHPDLQAVYVFGSRSGGTQHAQSDCDVALLLPPETARRAGALALSELHQTLERELRMEVDLVNLRRVSTVFAKEVLATGERIGAADSAAADEFEALTLSLYQELNVERAELLRDFERTGIAVEP